MSRDPIVSSNNDAESALSDDELDGVVGGRDPVLGLPVCTHGRTAQHTISGTTVICTGPFNQQG
jgi:hypothetical protein